MTRQGGMKQAARDWLNRTDATGNGILNGKNESDVRTGLTSVCQLLYFPISCFFTSPNWCTLSPNSPIEKKEISNDRTRPADQGFFFVSQARPLQRLYYRSESDAPYWPAEEHPYKRMNGKQARSILLELSLLHPLYSYIWIPSLSFPFSARWDSSRL